MLRHVKSSSYYGKAFKDIYEVTVSNERIQRSDKKGPNKLHLIKKPVVFHIDRNDINKYYLPKKMDENTRLTITRTLDTKHPRKARLPRDVQRNIFEYIEGKKSKGPSKIEVGDSDYDEDIDLSESSSDSDTDSSDLYGGRKTKHINKITRKRIKTHRIKSRKYRKSRKTYK